MEVLKTLTLVLFLHDIFLVKVMWTQETVTVIKRFGNNSPVSQYRDVLAVGW